jgi:hypothetical protein
VTFSPTSAASSSGTSSPGARPSGADRPQGGTVFLGSRLTGKTVTAPPGTVQLEHDRLGAEQQLLALPPAARASAEGDSCGISTCRGVRLSGTADRTSPTTAWPQASLASARTGTEPSSTSPLLHPGPKPGLISRSDLVVVQPGPLDTAALTAGPAEVPAHGWATISTTITAYRTRPSTVIQ